MSSGRTPEDYRDFFASVLADLDACPRRTGVRVWCDGLTLDLEDGNPVFSVAGHPPCRANFRRRWLAEHPVPFTFGPRCVRIHLIPTTGNRVKVRF